MANDRNVLHRDRVDAAMRDEVPPREPGGGSPPAAPAPPSGARFRQLREIARGGMGRVVEAFDLELQRMVAVKEILDGTPDARRRFAREVAITARLEHPSIVPLYDAGTSPSGDPFYVMRLLSGAPLDQVIRDATTLDQRLVVLPNLLAVADAVAHAHGHGVIHRDLKPANVLVGELGDTVVIDWGLAKVIGEPADPLIAGAHRAGDSLRTIAGTVAGTPGFMAPEQALGEPTDARTDVYALGACLYYVLAGRPPLSGGELEVLARTASGDIARLPAVAPGVPPELVTIVEKAMARDPRARYLDAGGLSEDLRRFLGGQLVASHRYPWPERLVRWLRRHRALVTAIAVAAAISIAGGALGVRRILAEQARTRAALVRERERGDDLVIMQAAGQLEADPTLAVATLRQLRPDSPRWTTLGPMLADARSRGVAVGYPGHGRALASIELAPRPGDRRLLTAGGGAVRIDDLARRTSTPILEGASPALRAMWCGELVVVNDRGTAFIDPRTGARAALAWPAEVVSRTSADGVFVFADDNGKLAAVDLAARLVAAEPVAGEPVAGSVTAGPVAGLMVATAPAVIPVGFHASTVEASPSGAWLVASDPASHAWLLRRRGRTTWDVVRELEGETLATAFDADEHRLAIVRTVQRDPGAEPAAGRTRDEARGVVELDLEALAVGRTWPAAPVLAVSYAGDLLYALVSSPREIRRLGDRGATTPVGTYEQITGRTIAGLGEWLVALETTRTIAITNATARYTVRAPQEVSQILVRGDTLVGQGPSSVMVWDLSEIVPERAAVASGQRLAFADDDLVIAVDPTGERSPDGVPRFHRYSLGPGTRGRGPLIAGSRAIASTRAFDRIVVTPGGGVVASAELPRGALTFVDPPIDPGIGEVLCIARLDRATLVVGTRTGEVHWLELASGRTSVLTRMSGAIVAVAASGGWIVAQADDGALWRRGPEGRETRAVSSELGVAITRAGTVYTSRDLELVAWSTGAPTPVARLAQPVEALHVASAERVAVVTQDRALAIYDPATHDVRTVLPASTQIAFAANGALAAAALDGGISVVDLVTGERWPIAERLDALPNGIAVSPDAHTLVVSDRDASGRDALSRFDLELARSPFAWARDATNAAPPSTPRGPIEWRALPAAR